jgi:diguanylate cyclase (GGDEF)-like protein
MSRTARASKRKTNRSTVTHAASHLADHACCTAHEKASEAPPHELNAQGVFEAFTKSFADGIAIFAPDNRLVYFNEPFRELLRPIADALFIGMHHRDLVAVGMARKTWDLQGDDATEWQRKMALAQVSGTQESVIKLTNSDWIMRRGVRSEDGYTVLLYSKLTKWKQREDDMKAALVRAEKAEHESRLALIAEEGRKQEETMLSHLNHWLHSCKRIEELHEVVQSFLSRLLPKSKGTLYIYNNSRDILAPACSWNTKRVATEIKPDDCWGLRQGRAYHHGHDGWRFDCDHHRHSHGEEPEHDYFCIPILAHGDTAGMLHVVPHVDCNTSPAAVERAFKIACKCAEQVSLAIANVKLSQELQDQSTHDPLTDLFNRRYFIERCAREFTKAKQTGVRSAIISIDIDHFKKFNDNFGHDAGDVVLKSFARVMADHFRADDVVARLGGEEFCILLPGASMEIGILRAQTLLPKIQKMTVRYGNETLPGITASAGVAAAPENGTSVQDVLHVADVALYQAKAKGRNCVVASNGSTTVPVPVSAEAQHEQRTRGERR